MRALTVQQPWAQAIAVGAKVVENRATRWGYVGPLAVHAGARWSERGAADVRCRALWPDLAPSDRFRHSAVVAVVDVVDCHPVRPGCCTHLWADAMYAGVPVGAHLVMANARELPHPVPTPGRLGLWRLPPVVEAAVTAQLHALARQGTVTDPCASGHGTVNDPC